MGIFDEVKGQLDANEDQVEAGIDAVGDFIDDKTGGKFSDVVDQAQDAAKDWVGEPNQ